MLKLENRQGYPRHIIVRSSSDSPGAGITVQDVLRTIHEDMRTLSCRRDWTRLNAKERAAVNVAFSRRCRTQTELSEGPRRIDYLCGRNRLQILQKHSPHGDILSALETFTSWRHTICAYNTVTMLGKTSVGKPSVIVLSSHVQHTPILL
jgi:hypothetical protein